MRRPTLRLTHVLAPLRRAVDHSFVDLPPRVVGLTVLSGVTGGLVGAGYLLVLHLLQHVLWPTEHSAIVNAVVLAAVGLTVGLLARVMGSAGDVELMVDNIHVSGTATGMRSLRTLVPTSLLCIAAGGAMGPEAPLVQTTGSLASHTAQRNRLAVREARIVTISGMAAGFAVLFGAPLGAAVFALELLHRRGLQYYEAIMPAVIGAIAGWAVHAAVTGAGLAPVWQLPSPPALQGSDVAWAVVAGLAGAVIAGAFVGVCRLLHRGARRLPAVARPLIGGLVLGGLGALSVWALTFGEDQIGEILSRHAVTLGVLLAAAAAKLVATSVTWATEWRGGFIIPLFFVGACVGRALHLAAPGTTEAVLVAGCMAAGVAAVTRTPIGSALVVSGMAGLRLLPTTLLASVVAFTLSGNLGLITTQRERDGGALADGGRPSGLLPSEQEGTGDAGGS